MLLVKKYANRRLYDTRHSRYITLEDLERTIRGGEDVTVQDAQDGRDLTQETLTQIILDRGGGRLLPAGLLLRLIRLDDAALGEFLTRYVGWALDLYLQAKDRARSLLPLNPLATAPFAATDALARLVLGAAQWGRGATDVAPQPHGSGPAPAAPPPFEATPPMPEPEAAPPARASSPTDVADEMARLRREIEELKESIAPAAGRARPKKKTRRSPRG